MRNKPIDSFPSDDQLWRLGWFGDVFYRRERRYKQPFVRISLSKVSTDQLSDWPYPDCFEKLPDQLQVSVPVSMLASLRIGTIWKNGHLHSSPSYTCETFQLLIEKDATTVIKAGLADDNGKFKLPFETHPYHANHTHSYCLQATPSEGVRLILPAIEMIRFYFGSSSNFLGRLFQGPFRESRYWTQAEIDEYGFASIELAKGISGLSASDVARIAFNSFAAHAGRLITNSLVLTHGSEERRYPKMVFPFQGNTRLSVRGIWLRGVAPATFLAFEILSCTHPFPFANLNYTMSSWRGAKGAGKNKSETSSDSEFIRQSRSGSGNRPLVNGAPDSRWKPKGQRFQSGSRFPDLDRKPVVRVDPTSPIRVLESTCTEQPSAVAVGEGEWKSGIQPIDLVAANEAPVPKGHPLQASDFAKFISKTVTLLQKEGKTVWFVPLDPRQRFPQFSLMPEIVTKDGEIDPLSYIEANGKTRPRNICVLRVTHHRALMDEVWLLMENGQSTASVEECRTLVFKIEEGCVIDPNWIAAQILQLQPC